MWKLQKHKTLLDKITQKESYKCGDIIIGDTCTPPHQIFLHLRAIDMHVYIGKGDELHKNDIELIGFFIGDKAAHMFAHYYSTKTSLKEIRDAISDWLIGK